MSLGAVVLCGGGSRRMGQSKAWLPFGPETMLQRVVRLASARANSVVVVGAPGQSLPTVPEGVRVVCDVVAGRGPLQGLAAGLQAMPDAVDLVYATGTDAPFLKPAWIDRLIALIGSADLAIPFVDDYYHPLAALYRRSAVLPAIERLLRADRLRPVFLKDAVRSRIVTADDIRAVDASFETLRNVNEPDDYKRALRDAGFDF